MAINQMQLHICQNTANLGEHPSLWQFEKAYMCRKKSHKLPCLLWCAVVALYDAPPTVPPLAALYRKQRRLSGWNVPIAYN